MSEAQRMDGADRTGRAGRAGRPGQSGQDASAGPRPAVIVDHASITYQVYASGKKVAGAQRGRARSTHAVQAVKDVSFRVDAGESVGLIGSNGSGKSSLLRGIAGLEPLSGGVIFASAEPSLLGVGAALINDLSGARNIVLGCLALGFTRAEVDERFDDIVEFSGLGEFIDMPMRTYSSGMSARLKFSIAATRPSDILLIDEALSVGDRAFRARSDERIRQLQAASGTVFLVSHSMRAVRDACERAIWINKGALMADGPVDEVVAAYEDSGAGKSGKKK
jgi:teichoic acid transport system ATP-binding protein